jgi:hypothetical protein
MGYRGSLSYVAMTILPSDTGVGFRFALILKIPLGMEPSMVTVGYNLSKPRSLRMSLSFSHIDIFHYRA